MIQMAIQVAARGLGSIFRVDFYSGDPDGSILKLTALRQEIAKPESVSLHDRAFGKSYWLSEVRPIENKRVKFTVFAAGIYIWWER